MERLSHAVIRHRWLILIVTALLCVLSVFAASTVTVNYDLASYLPSDAPSTVALGKLSQAQPNLQLYQPGLSLLEARAFKKTLQDTPGIQEVLWLDDVMDFRDQPIQMLDQDLLSQFYKDGPLYQITVDSALEASVVQGLRDAHPSALLKGVAADNAQTINVTMMEIASIMVYVLPLVLIILILATRHWLEPLLFLLAIGIAILLNEGSNVVFGSVSFITRACSAILQLAVSIDYAVFLLHRFGELRDQGMEPVEAMRQAMVKAASSIASSAMTTVFGFLALVLMTFKLGPDMGFVLAKGVLISYLSVMITLPAITVVSVKWLDKTLHRSFMPSFKGFGRFVLRFGLPLFIIAILILPLAYMAQDRNTFIYGSSGMHSPESAIRQEAKKIDQLFGDSLMQLVMVPQGDLARETTLQRQLKELPHVVDVLSYVGSVSPEIPHQILPEVATSNFYQDGLARFVLLADTNDEGPEAFALVEAIRETVDQLYPEESHLLSQSAANYDLRQYITADALKVLLAGILAIGLILLINFRNLIIPLILLFIIEGSIWLNMAVPYVSGIPLNYLGYMIVSSVQLGATVDYGILLTQRYLEARRLLSPKEAAAEALCLSTGSILPPVLILTVAGYSLGILISGNGIISEMGIIIGRGAAISGTMVLLVLPFALVVLDALIQKTFIFQRKKREDKKNA